MLMYRGMASLLGMMIFLTGCGGLKSLPPVSAIGVPTAVDIKYWIDPSTPQTAPSITLGANRTRNTRLPQIPFGSRLKLQALSFDASSSVLTEYVIVLGPSALVQITPQNWVQVDSGWAYVSMPHGGLYWNPAHYP